MFSALSSQPCLRLQKYLESQLHLDLKLQIMENLLHPRVRCSNIVGKKKKTLERHLGWILLSTSGFRKFLLAAKFELKSYTEDD